MVPSLCEISTSAPRRAAAEPASLLDELLREQQTLTAVERFAAWHETDSMPLPARRYSTLLPASPPGPGEQYAFDVDLDACSGCKSCVTACHTLNGLDEHETWRDVGLLHGGTAELPVLQHVTAACHHCLDPACMNGCPVKAYEKDPVTGIVRHLDDQCIGCQYCMLACPYDVPKYNHRLGIVRKCDMCSSRLAVGEAPACAQACPNEAIRITVVRQREVIENCETSQFLPGAPESGITMPTTNYKTRRALPRNLLPADYYSVHPERAHWPLVVMLVLTQLSVGAFAVALVLESLVRPEVLVEVSRVHAAGALVFGLLALGASVFHLGRPHLAFRAVIGLGTSWLSREILAFGAFAALATAYAALTWWQPRDDAGVTEVASSNIHSSNERVAAEPSGAMTRTRPPRFGRTALGWSVVLAGVSGVICSIMIYGSTRRRFWSGTATSFKFLLTAVVLGVATTLVASLAAAAWTPGLTLNQVLTDYGASLAKLLIAAAGGKLFFEAASLRHLRDKQNSPAKRSAILMTGPLGRAAAWRFLCGLIGGLVLPALLLAHGSAAGHTNPSESFIGAIVLASFVACVLGELLERYLFFTAVVAPRMPGRLVT